MRDFIWAGVVLAFAYLAFTQGYRAGARHEALTHEAYINHVVNGGDYEIR